MNVLNGGPARVDHEFEIVDPLFDAAWQPRQTRIVPHGVVVPALSRPLFGRLREFDFVIHGAIHPIRMGGWDVMLHDDFGVRIELLDAANESNSVARV